MNSTQWDSLPPAIYRLGRCALVLLLMVVLSKPVLADEKPSSLVTVRAQITGLFCPEREKDLREVLSQLPHLRLEKLDYENAEITIRCDPAVAWPGEKPKQYLERLDNDIGKLCRYSFRVKQPRSIPVDKLKPIEIPVEGLDCLGCSFGAYRLIYELPGVEAAKVDFKRGKVTAFIDPTKTSREKLVEVLKKGGVEIAGTQHK